MAIEITTQSTLTRYAFRAHTARMRKVAIPAAITLCVTAVFIALAFVNALPQGLGTLVALAFVLAVVSFIVLVPLVLFFYTYNKGGLWLDDQGVRVRFPASNEQYIRWDEALYAVDEGEEYLVSSKGKEGLGHLVAKDRYIRLHLEGMTPEQRAEIKERIAKYVKIRRPQKFTFCTLFNSKGEKVARGRLYLFENALLCAENRGATRVFIAAPLEKLGWVRRREPYYVGRLECEAFVLYYDKKEFNVMLGYETTVRHALGTHSSWVPTGYAQEWIEAIQPASR